MKSKWTIIASVTVVLVLIIAGVAVHFWFESPGVRVFGDDIHAELSGKCFVIDSDKGEVIDETELYLNGSTSSADNTLFDGQLSVVGYQNTAEGIITSTMGVEQTKNGYWIIRHIQSCTHRETIDGITQDKEHFCTYEYLYYLNPDLQDQVIVRIESINDDPLFAVRADSKEEALARYRSFLAGQ